jgi:hypothetical protein
MKLRRRKRSGLRRDLSVYLSLTGLVIAAVLLIAPAGGHAQTRTALGISDQPNRTDKAGLSELLGLSGLPGLGGLLGLSGPPGSGVDPCPNGKLPTGGAGADLEITTACTAGAGTYYYGNVNIYNGGSLTFVEAPSGGIDFWARGILIENNASLIAGSPSKPFGALGAVLTFHLWGPQQDATPSLGGQGITCKTPITNDAPCGIDPDAWRDGSTRKVTLPSNDPSNKPVDYFYQYKPLPFDGGGEPVGYFGYKVLALSYGGTLQLFGWKGAKYGTVQPNDSGESWARLTPRLIQRTRPPRAR